MDVPIEILDREAARAAADLAAARALLAEGDLAADPGPLAAHRRVSSRATYAELAEAQGPLAAPLRAWVAALTLERVLWADVVRFEAAWRAPTIEVAAPRVPPFTASPRDLLARALAARDEGLRGAFAGALAGGAGAVADAARIAAERRAEAARLLGADLDAIEIPIDPPASLIPIAERLLAETDAMLERRRSLSHALGEGVAREQGEGWPARLSRRWTLDLFRGTGLADGLRLDPGRLPQPIGALSFARALAAFGAALSDAARPAGAPFVLARAPFDLRRARRRALFGALAADPVFGVRALGLGRSRAIDQARGVARALLASLRLDAARVLLRGALLLPARALASRFEEQTAAALGAPFPPGLAGVVPRLGPEGPSLFAGAILAAADRRALCERFDEDWFRSPHAARAIREEEAKVPASHAVPAADVEAALAELCRALGASL
jgi:hypothetical protein